MIWHDNGRGTAQDSLAFFRQYKDDIGKITHVEMLKYYNSDGFVKYPFRIRGINGEIWLSGCSSGHDGAGPCGTARVLAELGYAVAYQHYASKRSSFKLGPPDKPELNELKPPPGWELSEETLNVLKAIQNLHREFGKMPTVRKISERAGYRSTSGAQRRIDELEKHSKLRRVKSHGIVWFEGMPE